MSSVESNGFHDSKGTGEGRIICHQLVSNLGPTFYYGASATVPKWHLPECLPLEKKLGVCLASKVSSPPERWGAIAEAFVSKGFSIAWMWAANTKYACSTTPSSALKLHPPQGGRWELWWAKFVRLFNTWSLKAQVSLSLIPKSLKKSLRKHVLRLF